MKEISPASHGQVEELEVQVDDLEGQIAVLKELTERQESLIRELHAARFGRSSEKLTPDERQLVFEDLEVALAQTEEQAAEAEQDAPSGTQHEDKKKKKTATAQSRQSSPKPAAHRAGYRAGKHRVSVRLRADAQDR